MLVISRKSGERILIGESVEVTILAIRGDQVSLGVSAPREVVIHREELRERIRRENQRATDFQVGMLQAIHDRLHPQLAGMAPDVRPTAPTPEAPLPSGPLA